VGLGGFLKINPIISICYGSEARFCDFHFDPSPYACSYAVALDKLSVQEHKHFFGTLMKAHASLDRYLESFRALLGANIERVLGIRMAPAEWKLEVTPPRPAGYKHRPGLSIPLRPVVVFDSHGRFPRPFRAPFYPATGPAGLCQYLVSSRHPSLYPGPLPRHLQAPCPLVARTHRRRNHQPLQACQDDGPPDDGENGTGFRFSVRPGEADSPHPPVSFPPTAAMSWTVSSTPWGIFRNCRQPWRGSGSRR